MFKPLYFWGHACTLEHGDEDAGALPDWPWSMLGGGLCPCAWTLCERSGHSHPLPLALLPLRWWPFSQPSSSAHFAFLWLSCFVWTELKCHLTSPTVPYTPTPGSLVTSHLLFYRCLYIALLWYLILYVSVVIATLSAQTPSLWKAETGYPMNEWMNEWMLCLS